MTAYLSALLVFAALVAASVYVVLAPLGSLAGAL